MMLMVSRPRPFKGLLEACPPLFFPDLPLRLMHPERACHALGCVGVGLDWIGTSFVHPARVQLSKDMISIPPSNSTTILCARDDDVILKNIDPILVRFLFPNLPLQHRH